MKYRRLIAVICCLLAVSCMRDIDRGDSENTTGPEVFLVPDEFSEKGMIRIKLNAESFEQLSMETKSGIPTTTTGIDALDQLAASLGATRIERTFHYGGKYEERRRKAGLHLWYDIYFDENIPVTRAVTDFSTIDVVEVVESSPRIKRYSSARIDYPQEMTESMMNAPGRKADHPSGFNDPRLPEQWHYYNDGSLNNAVAGADINVLGAWNKTTGDPSVIVCVTDGGVSLTHEDLIQNLWVNVAERDGVQGVDDDNNGYVDDIHGWNFVRNVSDVTPDDHGTHVAGTVAAVNNNGIGVGGVAGGNGSPNTGARVMSSQIFEGWSVATSTNTKNAIVYGADNGAVISQNSWGYDAGYLSDIMPSDKAAVDYFVQYAGTDVTGTVQEGPMKGGIVIFAAGNENSQSKAFPAAYDKCLSVVAMAHSLKRASFSNYGTWTDITAPGGDQDTYGYEYGVLSSTTPGNSYAYFQGTSMACPHVSGVAALVVSYRGVGNPGFTCDMLRDILESAVNDVYEYNPQYAGKMGTGYIDATKALMDDAGIPPDPVTDLSVTWGVGSAVLEWSVTADRDNDKASSYDALVSKSDLSGADFTNPPAGAVKQTVGVGNKAVGDKLQLSFDNLEEGVLYYVAITGQDMFGNRSQPAFISGTTLIDMPPTVTGTIQNIYIPGLSKTVSVDMDQYFTDDIDDMLTYEITVSPAELLKVTKVSRNEFKFTSNVFGIAGITVKAFDSRNQSAEAIILSVARDDSQEIDLYPNPFRSTLNIRMGQGVDGTMNVNVFNASGARVFSGSSHISTYSPAAIDLSGLSTGSYTVEVRYGGKTITRAITKL